MSSRYPGLPLVVAGFSFGARVGLKVACADSRVERVVPAGTPVVRGDWSYLGQCGCTKHFLHGSNDEHGPRDAMETVFASTAEPKRITWIEAADHFFSDNLDGLEDAALEAFATP